MLQYTCCIDLDTRDGLTPERVREDLVEALTRRAHERGWLSVRVFGVEIREPDEEDA